MLHRNCVREDWEECERNNPAHTKVIGEGGGAGPTGTRAEIYLQPVGRTIAKQVVLPQPMEDHSGAAIQTAAHGDPTLEQDSGRACGPMGHPH